MSFLLTFWGWEAQQQSLPHKHKVLSPDPQQTHAEKNKNKNGMLQGQKRILKAYKMSGVGVHDIKFTKNKKTGKEKSTPQ